MKANNAQAGATLIIVLALLLVMTLLGMMVVRGTLMGERMGANMYDRSLAFQQAESAMRQAEANVRHQIISRGMGWSIGVKCGEDSNTAAGGITDSLCAFPSNAFSGGGAACPDAGAKTNCWFNAADTLGAGNNSPVNAPPQYYVQFMGVRNTAIDLGLDSSANSSQYGGNPGVIREAVFRIVSRSHDPAAAPGRSVVVLQASIVAR